MLTIYFKVSNHKYALKNEYVESTKKFIVGSFGLGEGFTFSSCSSFIVEIKEAYVHEYFETTAVNHLGDSMKLMAEFLYFNVGTTKNTLPEIKEKEITFTLYGVKDLLEKNYYTAQAIPALLTLTPAMVLGTKGDTIITIYIDASEEFISNIEKNAEEGTHIFRYNNIVYVSTAEEPFNMFTNKNYQEEYSSEELLLFFDKFNDSNCFRVDVRIDGRIEMMFSQNVNSYEYALGEYDFVKFVKFDDERLAYYNGDDLEFKIYYPSSDVYELFTAYDFTNSLIDLHLPLTAKVDKKDGKIILSNVSINEIFEDSELCPNEIFADARISGDVYIQVKGDFIIFTFEMIHDNKYNEVEISILFKDPNENDFECAYFTNYDIMGIYLAEFGYDPKCSFVEDIGDFTIVEYESDNGKIQFSNATTLSYGADILVDQGFEQYGFYFFKLLDGADSSILKFFEFAE